ncbi:hypothetical protein Gotri_018433 [Gossypium trilobum]|uniref:glutathione transferase n=1 Tax=Gossypium trilobum TaxID=34281 RepID=A0A7J9E9M9_9ROSI|nr:hypothetical protein [Gossypium trilobum]
MEELKLLGNWASPFSYRVLWALKHKGVKYEYVEEDLFNKSELLLRCNPIHKQIPVLVHAGKPVPESIIILEYIEDTWPQNSLLPLDPHERTMARFWIKFGEDKAPIFYKFFHTVGEEQVKGTKEAEELLKTIEEYGLGDKEFFGGEELGLTDIAYGWIACWLDVLAEAAGVEMLGPQSFPRLQAWAERFSSEVKSLFKKLGVEPLVIELDELGPQGPQLQNVLEGLTGQRTVPNVFIDTVELYHNGELESLLSDANAKRKEN